MTTVILKVHKLHKINLITQNPYLLKSAVKLTLTVTSFKGYQSRKGQKEKVLSSNYRQKGTSSLMGHTTKVGNKSANTIHENPWYTIHKPIFHIREVYKLWTVVKLQAYHAGEGRVFRKPSSLHKCFRTCIYVSWQRQWVVPSWHNFSLFAHVTSMGSPNKSFDWRIWLIPAGS